MALREIKMTRSHEYAKQCTDCGVICLETLNHCIHQGMDHKESGHLQILRDCAELCATTANFLATDSYYRTELAMVCAEICDACALSCEQFYDDEQIANCAEACLACAISCRRISIELAA
ncbi:MAG: four-helix bundle copper-binding protein [Bdellovibrionota bacterium]